MHTLELSREVQLEMSGWGQRVGLDRGERQCREAEGGPVCRISPPLGATDLQMYSRKL